MHFFVSSDELSLKTDDDFSENEGKDSLREADFHRSDFRGIFTGNKSDLKLAS